MLDNIPQTMEKESSTKKVSFFPNKSNMDNIEHFH